MPALAWCMGNNLDRRTDQKTHKKQGHSIGRPQSNYGTISGSLSISEVNAVPIWGFTALAWVAMIPLTSVSLS